MGEEPERWRLGGSNASDPWVINRSRGVGGSGFVRRHLRSVVVAGVVVSALLVSGLVLLRRGEPATSVSMPPGTSSAVTPAAGDEGARGEESAAGTTSEPAPGPESPVAAPDDTGPSPSGGATQQSEAAAGGDGPAGDVEAASPNVEPTSTIAPGPAPTSTTSPPVSRPVTTTSPRDSTPPRVAVAVPTTTISKQGCGLPTEVTISVSVVDDGGATTVDAGGVSVYWHGNDYLAAGAAEVRTSPSGVTVRVGPYAKTSFGSSSPLTIRVLEGASARDAAGNTASIAPVSITLLGC